jgi:glycosyltransferase involved in cell wall biosynthesis
MKILLCHTYYTQRGGEDRSFEEERELLRGAGHEVIEYVQHNDAMNAMGRVAAAATTVWNRRAAADVAELVRTRTPDVVHCTNTFPLLSPAVCRAAHRGGAAVVQALRNYRLLCAGSYLLRDDRPCEDCIGRSVPWPAVVHRCYRDSAAASAAVAAMQVVHRAAGTWRRHVDAFFTLTEFARGKFLAAGFPADRVHVKYNSVHPDPGVGDGAGGFFAFAGRLSPEKGVATLLKAWRLDATLPPLKVIGDGPLAPQVAAAAADDPRIEWLGHRTEADVHGIFGRAMGVIVPSVWYETFGRTIAEAFAGGTPVIASRLGAMAELVADGRTGWLFAPGDAANLARAVAACRDTEDGPRATLRVAARAEYERQFTPMSNYRRLLEIYELALATARANSPRRAIPPVDRRTPVACTSAPTADPRLTPAKT